MNRHRRLPETKPQNAYSSQPPHQTSHSISQPLVAHRLVPLPAVMRFIDGNQVSISQVVQDVDGIYVYGLADIYGRFPLVYYVPHPQVFPKYQPYVPHGAFPTTQSPVIRPHNSEIDTETARNHESDKQEVGPSADSSTSPSESPIPPFDSQPGDASVDDVEQPGLSSSEHQQSDSNTSVMSRAADDSTSPKVKVRQSGPSTLLVNQSPEEEADQNDKASRLSPSVETPKHQDTSAQEAQEARKIVAHDFPSAPQEEEVEITFSGETTSSTPSQTLSKHQLKKQRKKATAKKQNRFKVLSQRAQRTSLPSIPLENAEEVKESDGKEVQESLMVEIKDSNPSETPKNMKSSDIVPLVVLAPIVQTLSESNDTPSHSESNVQHHHGISKKKKSVNPSKSTRPSSTANVIETTNPMDATKFERFLEENPDLRKVDGVLQLVQRFELLLTKISVVSNFSMSDFLIDVAKELIPGNKTEVGDANEFIFRFRTFQKIVIPDTEMKLDSAKERLQGLDDMRDRLFEKHGIKNERLDAPIKDPKVRKERNRVLAQLKHEAKKAADILVKVSMSVFKMPRTFTVMYAKLRESFNLKITIDDISGMLRDSQTIKERFGIASVVIKQYL